MNKLYKHVVDLHFKIYDEHLEIFVKQLQCANIIQTSYIFI